MLRMYISGIGDQEWLYVHEIQVIICRCSWSIPFKRRFFSRNFSQKSRKSRFTAKRRMLEKNVITTTPPFMTILPTRDIFGTRIVNILDLKSFLIYFSSRNLDFLGVFPERPGNTGHRKKNFAWLILNHKCRGGDSAHFDSWHDPPQKNHPSVRGY